VEPALEVSFGEADKPDNIILDEDGSVTAASFSKLVEKLTAAVVGVYFSEGARMQELFLLPVPCKSGAKTEGIGIPTFLTFS
jgi:hypothetical protein